MAKVLQRGGAERLPVRDARTIVQTLAENGTKSKDPDVLTSAGRIPCRQVSGLFFFSSRRRHTRWTGDWSSDVCSSDLQASRRAGTPCPHWRSGPAHRHPELAPLHRNGHRDGRRSAGEPNTTQSGSADCGASRRRATEAPSCTAHLSPRPPRSAPGPSPVHPPRSRWSSYRISNNYPSRVLAEETGHLSCDK